MLWQPIHDTGKIDALSFAPVSGDNAQLLADSAAVKLPAVKKLIRLANDAELEAK